MPFTMHDLVAAVKRHANQYYETDGFDYVVETYTDSDIERVIGDATTPAQAIARVRRAVLPLAEMRDEIRAASGEY